MIHLRVQEFAKERNITKQKGLAELSGCTPQVINRYWNQIVRRVDLVELNKIAIALKVGIGDLLVSDDDPLKEEDQVREKDMYFSPSWELEHPYLAKLWSKVLEAPEQKLFARKDQLSLVLRKGRVGSVSVLLLSWGNEDGNRSGHIADTPLTIGEDLSDLFQNAQDAGLPILVDEQSIPLEKWQTI